MLLAVQVASLSSFLISWKLWSLFYSKLLVFQLGKVGPRFPLVPLGVNEAPLHTDPLSTQDKEHREDSTVLQDPQKQLFQGLWAFVTHMSRVCTWRVRSFNLFSLNFQQRSNPVQCLRIVGTLFTVASKATWASWNSTLPFWFWYLLQLWACWSQHPDEWGYLGRVAHSLNLEGCVPREDWHS